MWKNKRQIDDYTEEELRRVLCERFRVARQERRKEFHRSGKIRFQEPLLSSNRPAHIKSGSEACRERSRFNNLLKVVEVGLLFSFLLLGLSGWKMLGNLNRQTRSSWQVPVVTPTPLITPVVLPSGHTQNTTRVRVYSKIPNIHGFEGSTEQYMPLRADPTSEPEFAIRIVIPSIGVDAPVVLGVESEQLKKGVGQVPGSANPGQRGNLVLSAHNDIYGELFRYLDQLKSGDQFTVYTNLRAYTYTVTGWELVEPTRVEVLKSTPNTTATLISCYPYLVDTMRIIVRALLVEN
jgi:sortase A